MKFTKKDVLIKEIYSPPSGEKEIIIIDNIKLIAYRKIKYDGYLWIVNYIYELFTTIDRLTVFDVVNFLNNPSIKRTEFFRSLIKDRFKW